MSHQASAQVTDQWLDALLGLPTRNQQLALLAQAELLDLQGLSLLLGQAMQLVRRDPGKARQLIDVCAMAAEAAQAAQILPHTTYARAQTYAISGDFTTALDLIHTARAEFEAAGETLEALRTNLGKIHVLNELGRHEEALAAGQAILDAVEKSEQPRSQLKMMAAVAHQNQGACFETIGRYEEALAAYDLAEEDFTELEMSDRIGDVCSNRGIVLVHLGRVSEALQAFEKALHILSGAGLTLLEAQTLSNMGEAHMMLGNYARSLEIFERARRFFEELHAPANQAILARKTADAYLVLNLYPEAVNLYHQAIAMIQQAGMADHHARALWGLGAALAAQGQHREAAEALQGATQRFTAAGNTPMVSSVLLEQSALQNAQGDLQAAYLSAERALDLVPGEVWPVERLYASLRLADLSMPDLEAAESYLQEAGRLAADLRLPVGDYRLNSRLGRLRLLQGRKDEARQHLETAVAQIERLRSGLSHEAVRTSFLQDKTNVYEDLIELHLKSGDAGDIRQAFKVAEQAKSRALVDLLANVIVSEQPLGEHQEVAAELKTLQADLDAVYNRLLDPFTSLPGSSLAQIQQRAAQLEQQIRQLQLRTTGRFVEVDPFAVPFSFEALRAQIPPGGALVAYHILGDEILAFLVKGGEIEIVRGLSSVPRLRDLIQRMSAHWGHFRMGDEFTRRHMTVLEKSAQRFLAALHTELIAPLEDALRVPAAGNDASPTRLVIVPHGLLHQVPFHALYTGDRYLIDDFEISYALSATVFTLCQEREHRQPQKGLVVALSDSLIPAAEAEGRSVSRLLQSAGVEVDLLCAERARRDPLILAATGCDVLHLACHGLFRADNPIFSALKLSDGWLTAAEVLNLRMEGALVALSACESGRNRVISGDEAIGLPRAFLGAGASSVLVSLWVVQDETTVTLMEQWYELLCAGAERTAALRQAQQTLRGRYPHPYYWAPFIIIGQR